MSSIVTEPLTAKRGASVIDQVSQLYGVENWGADYFFLNERGHVAAAPYKNRLQSIDILEVVTRLTQRKLSPPFLLRFPQMLDERMAALHEAFRHAIKEFQYGNRHLGVYPVKVNQKAEVVRRLMSSGRRYDYGIEVGSKAELLAALALPLSERALVICNGLKDDLFLRIALLAEKVGKTALIVGEEPEDIRAALDVGEKLGIEPNLGIRVKLYSRGSGKWEESGGEIAKFGMSTIDLVNTLELLKQRGKASCLRMLHFHIGSQITDIKRAKRAFKEAARVYAKTRKMGFNVQYLNVGGGLGVDYDGSKTASEFSVNYTLQEFANDVIYVIGEICDNEDVPAPVVVTEAGRAMVAYHSVLVTDVKKVIQPGGQGNYTLEALQSKSEPVLEMLEIAREINAKNFREYYHDALQQRDDLHALFELGYLDLEDKSKGEWLFWNICRRASKLSRTLKQRPEEFEELDRMLAAKYVCNFSMFQSLPDFWAFDQLFPIMPIHRLDEPPSEQGILCDITCDSDGSIDKFVDVKDVKESLALHPFVPGEPYYLAMLLLGAYQETLGDLHNLFGVVTEANVIVGQDGRMLIDKLIRGDTVREVLEYTGHEMDELRESIAKQVSSRKVAGLIGDDDEHEVLATASRVLDDYTYLG